MTVRTRRFGILALAPACLLIAACAGMAPPPGAARTASPQLADGSVETVLKYEAGLVSVRGDFMELPESEKPDGIAIEAPFFDRAKSSRWIGLVIPPPAAGLARAGTVTVRILEDGRRDRELSDLRYNEAEPLLIRFAALAPSRRIRLELSWPRGFAEELTVEFTDTRKRPADNLFIHRRGDFTGGHDGTRLVDGELGIAAGATGGTAKAYYTSPVYHTPPFEDMVLSWNAVTPADSAIELEARVLRADGQWAEWLSWGSWGSRRENSNTSMTGTYARIIDDVYALRGGSGEEGVAFQYRAHLIPGASGEEPRIQLIAASLRNGRPGRGLPKPFVPVSIAGLSIDLKLPRYSQYLRDPQFAAAICSPTSLTMVMEALGRARIVEEVAMLSYDRGLGAEGGYGNWAYNAAAAGANGLEAWVDYLGAEDAASVALLLSDLKAGFPVIASVKYRNATTVASTWPVLDGAPIASTSGHLVAIGGAFEREGELWLVVNDPAAPDDVSVRREYRANQFLRAWDQRLAYRFRTRSSAAGAEPDAPVWLAASLESTGRTRERAGITQTEYALKTPDGRLVSLANRARSRYLSIAYRLPNGAMAYVQPDREDFVWLDPAAESTAADFFIMFTDGRRYRADIRP